MYTKMLMNILIRFSRDVYTCWGNHACANNLSPARPGNEARISFTLVYVCVFPVEEAALMITRDVYLYCSH